MADPAKTEDQNLLPVQAYFAVDGTFQTFIGQGQPFYATVNPDQSGLHITNSTIDSTTIGATTPSTGVFTNISATTGQVLTAPTANTDITNKQYVDSIAQGLNPKQAVKCATTANITLSGLQTIDTYTTLAGDRVLVKNQSTSSQNGIYIAASGAWTRSTDMDVWSEVPGAYTVVLNGSVNYQTGWVCTASDTGTIGVTSMPWVQFSGAGTYFAGTGLTLLANTFSITNTGVTAASYGSASNTLTATVNAQGQLTALAATPIAIANTQVSGLGTMSTQNANAVAITGGTINGAVIGGTGAAAVTGTTITATTQFSGAGTGLTGTASGLSIGGNAATATTAVSATSATTATNLAGGATGSVPYQSGSGATTFLGVGTNGQVLTLAAGVPSWATPTTGTVTSVSGTGTVSGITLTGTVTTSGNLTLGGTLDLSSPPAIGGTTPAAITGTTITATTKFVGPYFDAANSAGGALRNASGTAQLQWGSGGGSNLSLDVSTNMNGTNAQIDISPTGTGYVHIKPTGSGSIEIAPTNAGTLDNLVIGGVTPLAGTFTALRFNTTLSVNGSTGTTGQVLTSNGSSAPTWTTPTAGITISDDTTTNSTRYPLFTSATTGTVSTEYVSSTKYQFNPSTGVLTATSFSGAGTGLTGTASGLSIGGNAATATSATTATNLAGGANGSLPYQTGSGATTMLAAGTNGYIMTLAGGVPTWAAAPATGITVTDDTTTNADRYLTFTSATTGSITGEDVSSTKLKYKPSTGALSATDFVGTIGATTPAAGTFTTLTATTVQNSTLDNTNTVTLKDTLFTLQDDADTTKQAKFQLSGIATGTTVTYTLPVGSAGTSTLIDSVSTQTISAVKIFSATTQNVGSSSLTSTNNFAYGATTSGNTKTVNIGTAGLSGSTTNINIGSSVSGSLGTTTIQAPTVNIGQTATQFQVTNTASAVNYASVTGSITGSAVVFSASGSDTKIDLALTPKGTGVVKGNGVAISAENGIYMNKQTVATSMTIPTGYSASSSGPISVASGVIVTVSSGSRWVVL